MTYDRQILRILSDVGEQGISVQLLAKHVYNQNVSLFYTPDIEEIRSYVQQYLLKNSNKEPIESLEDVLLAVAQLAQWKLWIMGSKDGILHTGLDYLGVRMEGTGDLYGNLCCQ